ncbi:PDDEXK nuclease domain-containing protein [Chryseobacterium gambrini]|uniref:Predicted nuclease of restriction endonuclease-like (RecB) superfamily, DUF1016 family n=1 Tax=Chryseobacterium gambrini TaxID=373672 RepID=A0A1N7MH19_9FLAO|nr:PDDEXK nuclease domain-containing protein [Chryseobacterium gambrini]SIS85405.1 Predicted nuclease of restriction endonuclease-like (RecB) superfamily, DUF1016 family [Chryseobacterium gambrini]
MKDLQNTQLLQNISSLLDNARKKVAVAVNQTIVLTYYEIGRMIVEDEQNGENRAEYGKAVLKDLSLHLTERFGKGFSVSNLKQIRQFYIVYSKGQTLSDESGVITNQKPARQDSIKFNLSWSHYLKLMRITDINERRFYEIESYKNNWSLRELQIQYDSALYARLSLSKNKEEILQLAEKGQIIEKSKDLIKDPYVLEFLGLSEKPHYSEKELESELIDKLEHFLLELGTGFTFVARQDRITFDEKQFRIDLVFYNRVLRCFVLIDLKIGELKHQDIGQMQMYVNYYDREKRLEGENKTIVIILCQDKSEALVRYTLPEDNEQIFASKYFTILPSKQDFINILNSDNGKIS